MPLTDLHTVAYAAPDGTHYVIHLRARLSLAGTGAFHTAYQGVAAAHNDVVSDLELRVLLLMQYLYAWRGGVLDTVPCDGAALSVVPADLPILHLAMDAAYLLHFDPPPRPTHTRGMPIKDERHRTLVRRWLTRLGSQSKTDYPAGVHDQLVTLMHRFGWTEHQTLHDNSPEVLAELIAYMDAVHEREDKKSKRRTRDGGGGGGVPGELPTQMVEE